MMALSYEEILIHSWKRIESDEQQYHYLLNAFIRRMLALDIPSRDYRPGKEPRPEVTRTWLAILAQAMERDRACFFCPEQLQPSWLARRSDRTLYRFGVGLGMALICAGVAGVAVGVLVGWNYGTIVGAIALLLGLVAGLTQNTDQITLSAQDRLCSSTLWQTLIKVPGSAFVVGVIVGPALGLSLGMGLRYGPAIGALWALVWCVLFGLLWGAIRLLTPDIGTVRSPNQGIKQAVAIAGAIAPLASLIVGLVCGVGLGLVTEPSFGLTVGLISGLVTWFLLAFESLVASIQHLVLRLILVKNRQLPWNYSRFLNYATHRHLLQRVNGRYRFIHELLQTHFVKY
ncbi:hypothetical protein QM565_10295 [Geitlerinema splendidum]|nr:hypothetical protein [Geitlerinema splendidum]